jgi:hypothetical protein
MCAAVGSSKDKDIRVKVIRLRGGLGANGARLHPYALPRRTEDRIGNYASFARGWRGGALRRLRTEGRPGEIPTR